MNLDLTEEQIQIRDAVRELCRSEFAPHAAAWDAEQGVPHSAIEKLAEQGFLGMAIPEEWGGVGYDARTIVIVLEEIARVSAALAIMIAVHNSVGALPVFSFGNDAQRRRFLPRLVSRELGAFSLSEPAAGSDAGALEATAVRDGDGYLLNGAKNWVTNGINAGVYLIFARTDKAAGNKGISAFIVERGAPGLVIGKPENKMGLRGSETVALALDHLHVPADQLLGAEGDGFKIAMSMLDAGRIGVAAQALGVMTAAFEEAVKYAQQRRAFGGPIARIQSVQFKLAEMERRVQCARLLLRKAAWLRDTGRSYTRAASMAKLYASEAATWVTHQAIQVHGGYGYVKEYAVERYYRDARVMEIYEGTSEIQRLVIARSVLKDGVAV
ncbi:MAG: acyl-CoA dehydrogenase family protein [Candidatus Eisenbacteria bacterium]|nr:acyl-CoA dehydrogenase family protein [Candidatus Eisenbacteria bacterium]